MSDIREIQNQLGKLQLEYVQLLGKMLKGSGFFSKVGVVQNPDTLEVQTFAVPKVIYKDMLAEGTTDEELKNWAYNAPIPMEMDLMNETPMVKATQSLYAHLAHYIKGGRVVAVANMKAVDGVR